MLSVKIPFQKIKSKAKDSVSSEGVQRPDKLEDWYKESETVMRLCLII